MEGTGHNDAGRPAGSASDGTVGPSVTMSRTGVIPPWAARCARRLARTGWLVGAMLAAAAAHAAEPPTGGYAAMSLIGDTLSIVTFRQSTGSSLDKNLHDQVPLADDHFDRLVLRTVGATVARVRTGEAPALLLSHDAATYRRAEEASASPDAVDALLRPLASQLAETGSRDLILVTKRRDAARLKVYDGRVGTGWLSGLGFYIDHQMQLRNPENGVVGQGFVAPFVSLSVSLVDLRTRTIVRTEPVVDSLAAGIGPLSGGDPWAALTSDDKVRYLDELIERSLADAVPRLLAAS